MNVKFYHKCMTCVADGRWKDASVTLAVTSVASTSITHRNGKPVLQAILMKLKFSTSRLPEDFQQRINVSSCSKSFTNRSDIYPTRNIHSNTDFDFCIQKDFYQVYPHYFKCSKF
jgi:hypothetical protein